MTTIKSYTDISQSKKLAKILPLESADMFYALEGFIAVTSPYIKENLIPGDPTATPCWSLAALLGVLPEGTRLLKSTNISSIGDTKYHCDCSKGNIAVWFDNPVDACVEMIEKLHELNLL